jgi:DNA-binding beta-propeller fold protein YncE
MATEKIRYKVHPSIGVARLGNSDDFYLSPLDIGARPIEWDSRTNNEKFVAGKLQYVSKFKDDKGQIKKQAARFKIYRYDNQNPKGKEVSIDDEFDKVVWTVHLANKKGAWYEFSEYDGDVLFKEHSYDEQNSAFRNQAVMDEQRKHLIIDPGARSLDSSADKPGVVQEFKVESKEINSILINGTTGKPVTLWYPSKAPKFGELIENLGKILLDSNKNLVVLGGSGNSGGDQFFSGFAGGDTWYDDISDGPVTCEIHFKDKNRKPEVLEAWIIVGSPKYAPELVNISTLEDGIFDLYVRNMDLDKNLYDRSKIIKDPLPGQDPEEKCWNQNYYANFRQDIEPIMKRIAGYRWVANVPSMMAFYSPSFNVCDTSTDEEPTRNRMKYFSYFRDPGCLETGFQGDREQLFSGNSRVQRFNESGDFQLGFGTFGLKGQLRSPTGIAVDKEGFVYITDDGYYCVRKFDKDGNHVAKFGSYGKGDTQLILPICIAVDEKFIYVTDNTNNSVKIWDKNDGCFISKFGRYGKDDEDEKIYDKFILPVGIAVDKDYIYVSDIGNRCVKQFRKDFDHKFIRKFGSPKPSSEYLPSPQGVAVDKNGNLYVADKSSHCIKKFDSNGKFLKEIGVVDKKIAGRETAELGDNKITPYGVAVDDEGNIYVTDITNVGVKIFTPDGITKGMIGSYGSGDGQYRKPVDITVNENGIYVVDQDRYRGIPLMPLNAGSNSFTNDILDKFATLTKTQYFLLGQWAKGMFKNDCIDDYHMISKYDRSDIGNCSGIPMLPGIEVTWSSKNPIIYDKIQADESPPYSYRIKHRDVTPSPSDYRDEDNRKYYNRDLESFQGKKYDNIEEYYKEGLNPLRDETRGGGCEPGDLTKRMSPPWQADFFECNIEYISFAPDKNVNINGIPPPPSYYSYWWPPQSPYHVISGIESDKEQKEAGTPAGLSVVFTRGINSHMQMIDGWSFMGFIVNQNEDDEPYRSNYPYFVEKERNHDQFIVSSIATDHIDSVFSANNLNFAPVWHLKRHKQVDPQND